jgi:hypothetical protein
MNDTIKLAQMDGEWYFSEDGYEWHVMICSEVEYMTSSKGVDTCAVLYYEPV